MVVGKAEYVIQDVAGCGRFQVQDIIPVYLMCKLSIAFVIVFMSYGNYNPGWRCLDNVTVTTNNYNSITSTTLNDLNNTEYTVGSCDAYKRCSLVEFNPTTSTVLTEWSLICDKAWVSSLIISVQMAGMLIGAYIGGQLSDSFGRKKTTFGSIGTLTVLQLLSAFSVSWVMFIVIRFFMGICVAAMMGCAYVYISETLTMKWRSSLMALPFWYVGTTLLALVCLMFKNWRYIEFFSCGIVVIAFIPVLWVPESLRWLEVKDKSKSFMKVTRKIVRMNRKTMPLEEELISYKPDCNSESKSNKRFTLLDLFHPGYRSITLCVCFLNFTYSMMYYATMFGVKSVYGDIYRNMMLFSVVSMGFNILTIIGLRFMRRKTFVLLALTITISSCLGAVGCLLSDSLIAKSIISSILISIAKGSINAAWIAIYSQITEMYPTVVRSLAMGFGSLSARVGGIIAPFIIPDVKEDFYLFVVGAAVASIVCALVSLKLPETKGKQLKQDFDDVEPDKNLQTVSELKTCETL